jgi:phage tail-like protein
MADDIVYGTSSVMLEGLSGAESELKFFQAQMPSATVEIAEVKHFGENGKVAPLSGGGHQVQFPPITMSRYYDGTTALWDWFKQVMEKGAVTGETKQDPTITLLKEDGSPLYMWKLTGAVVTAYSEGEVNAQGESLATETITLSFEEADKTVA